MAKHKRTLSGLTAAKCPSCKIILLRPVPKSSSLMHCPTCDKQYRVEKGTIISSSIAIRVPELDKPVSIIVNDSTDKLPTASASDHNKVSTTRRQEPASNPLLDGKNVRLLPSRTPTRRHSFHCKDQETTSNARMSVLQPNDTGRCHRRGASLNILSVSSDSGKELWETSLSGSREHLVHKDYSRSLSSSERLQLPEIKSSQPTHNQDHSTVERRNSSSKFGKIKQFFSSQVWSRKSSPHSDCSSASSGKGLELPLVSHSRKGSIEESGSDTSLTGDLTVKRPCLTCLDALRKEFTEAKQTGSFDYIQELFVNTFSSWEEICNSFQIADERCSGQPNDEQALLGMDMHFVHYAYTVIGEAPQSVQRAVLKAIITGVLKGSKHRVFSRYGLMKDYVRVHLVLIENPQFYNTNTYIVFAQILRQISQMSDESHRTVIHWLRHHYRLEWFRDLINKIQQFISVRLYPPTPTELPPISKCSWWISCATKVLALFYKANWMDYPPMVSHDEFYNTTLDHIDLMSDFYLWQSPQNHTTSPRFSFCQYPFVLSMNAKKLMLQRDSEHQMLIMAKKSLAEKVQQNEMPETKNFFLSLTIRRAHIIEDSINELVQKQEDLKKKVKITFVGEPGLDMGGLTKEWFLLLIRRIFQPDYGLFTYHEDSGYYWFSTGPTEDNYNEYHLVGLLMGLAVYNNIILDIHFPHCCYKKLLIPLPMSTSRTTLCPIEVFPDHTHDQSVGMATLHLSDVIQVMPTVGRSLQQLKNYEGDVEELCFTFQVSHEEFGETVTTDLLPNGGSMAVTNDNRDYFIQRYVNHLLNESVSKQFSAFYHGFHRVCDSNALMLFRPEEIETLICGSAELDIKALETVTIYDGYERTDTTIRNFWETVHSFSTEQQQKLLLFVTGSYRIPVGGMTSMHFKISRLPFPSPTKINILPMAHTCFNNLLLPPYKTRKRLKEKLMIAITNAEGFGIE